MQNMGGHTEQIATADAHGREQMSEIVTFTFIQFSVICKDVWQSLLHIPALVTENSIWVHRLKRTNLVKKKTKKTCVCVCVWIALLG